MRRPLLAAALSAAAVAAPAAPGTASAHTPSLPLGPSGLHEQRETEQLAPGVTLTSIVRGETSAADVWTLHVRLPVPGNPSAVIAPKATAEDGTAATGPWRLHVITVDPRRFGGRVVSSVGGTLTATDKVPSLVRDSGAVAGVNGTYFTSAGRGGPAGLHVLDGGLTSEANNGRTAMILPQSGRGVRFAQLGTELRVRAQDRATRELDGVDRLPGLVDNCGGVGGDRPTERPQHDVTCTDPDELVAFTPVYGASSPAGSGSTPTPTGSSAPATTSRSTTTGCCAVTRARWSASTGTGGCSWSRRTAASPATARACPSRRPRRS